MPYTDNMPVSAHISATDQITASEYKRCEVHTFETEES